MEWSETVKIPEPVRELFNQLKKVLEKDIAKTEERSRKSNCHPRQAMLKCRQVGTVSPLRKGVLPMYVTYENLFLFVTMLTGVIALAIGIKHKK